MLRNLLKIVWGRDGKVEVFEYVLDAVWVMSQVLGLFRTVFGILSLGWPGTTLLVLI